MHRAAVNQADNLSWQYWMLASSGVKYLKWGFNIPLLRIVFYINLYVMIHFLLILQGRRQFDGGYLYMNWVF